VQKNENPEKVWGGKIDAGERHTKDRVMIEAEPEQGEKRPATGKKSTELMALESGGGDVRWGGI